ncbi:hypothetical protein DEJ50_07320 [Streptomyces venezuelae]|uniref:Uncharacterized protein n=1 Tax=Streptomyces venezuelae TaxID=54571 RepID=A0A5P2D0A9_STRVZ|nr:hypothetical protein [Streptomyces venezuelae]QES47657.1 hypothetical protein DEJ50_07320 [Streptomyces venezuelae]
MVTPAVVHDDRGRPVQWLDEAPVVEWMTRQGRAKYELARMDKLPPEERLLEDGLPAWMPKSTGPRTPMVQLNHPWLQLTVWERQQYGATAPWTTRDWVREKLKRGSGTAPMAVPAEAEELPQAEGVIAPSWAEG